LDYYFGSSTGLDKFLIPDFIVGFSTGLELRYDIGKGDSLFGISQVSQDYNTKIKPAARLSCRLCSDSFVVLFRLFENSRRNQRFYS
jgi:hypothetical protein